MLALIYRGRKMKNKIYIIIILTLCLLFVGCASKEYARANKKWLDVHAPQYKSYLKKNIPEGRQLEIALESVDKMVDLTNQQLEE